MLAAVSCNYFSYVLGGVKSGYLVMGKLGRAGSVHGMVHGIWWWASWALHGMAWCEGVGGGGDDVGWCSVGLE